MGVMWGQAAGQTPKFLAAAFAPKPTDRNVLRALAVRTNNRVV